MGFEDEAYEPLAVAASEGEHVGAILPTRLALQQQPSQASSSGNVKSETVAVAFAAYGLSAPLRVALLKAFECGEDECSEAMAQTPEKEVEEILEETLVDEERPPTRIEKGHVRSFFRKLRENLMPTVPVTQPQVSGPIVVQMPDTSDRLEYRDYIDQTLKGHFTLLAPAELYAIRKRYEAITGGACRGRGTAI